MNMENIWHSQKPLYCCYCLFGHILNTGCTDGPCFYSDWLYSCQCRELYAKEQKVEKRALAPAEEVGATNTSVKLFANKTQAFSWQSYPEMLSGRSSVSHTKTLHGCEWTDWLLQDLELVTSHMQGKSLLAFISPCLLSVNQRFNRP